MSLKNFFSRISILYLANSIVLVIIVLLSYAQGVPSKFKRNVISEENYALPINGVWSPASGRVFGGAKLLPNIDDSDVSDTDFERRLYTAPPDPLMVTTEAPTVMPTAIPTFIPIAKPNRNKYRPPYSVDTFHVGLEPIKSVPYVGLEPSERLRAWEKAESQQINTGDDITMDEINMDHGANTEKRFDFFKATRDALDGINVDQLFGLEPTPMATDQEASKRLMSGGELVDVEADKSLEQLIESLADESDADTK